MFEREHGEKADRTRAEDDGREAFDVAGPAYSVQADGQWLGQRRCLHRLPVGVGRHHR